MTWDRRHVLDGDVLSAHDLDELPGRSTEYRDARDAGDGRREELRGQPVALVILEPSTRTRLSFELAARRLGAETFLFDAGSSSLTKGESFVDTVRNLDAIGFDWLVVRHHRAGAAAVAARHFG